MKNVKNSVITKNVFEKYERVRSAGKYNMITGAAFAASEIGIDLEKYWNILTNHGKYAAEFGKTAG